MTLLDREPEHRLMEDLLQACSEGQRRGLVFTGPLGIGKSALLREALSIARDLNLSTAVIRAPQLSDITAADLISDILHQLAEPPDGNVSYTQPPTLFHQLDRSRSPVLIIIEDIDSLAPDTAAEFFDGLRRTTRPMAIVGSLASRTTGSAPPSSGDLWYDFVDVRPLASEQVDALAASYLEGPIVPAVGAMLMRASDGNPLFVLELLRSWKLSGTLKSVAGYWCWTDGEPPEIIPESIADAVGVRLEGLSNDERAILLALVLLGRSASLDELCAITGDVDSVKTLGRLSDQGFISEYRESHLAYTIAQPAYAAAIMRRTSATNIAAMHGAIYDVLLVRSQSTPSELALHGISALIEPTNLVEVVGAAAEAARRTHKYPQAADWYAYLARKAKDNTDRVPLLLAQADSETSFDPTRAIRTYTLALEEAHDHDAKAQALTGRAKANRRLGRHDDMRQDLDLASAIARSRHLTFDIEHALAVHAGITRRFSEAEARLNALRTDDLDEEQRAKVEGHLAQVAYANGDVGIAAARAEAALRLTRDSEQQAFLESNLGWYLTILGNWPRATVLLEARGNIAEVSGDVWTLANVRCDQARLQAWRGNVPAGIEFATAAIRLARLLDSTVDRVHSLDALGTALLEAGENSAAVDAFSRSLDLVESNVEPRDLALNHTQLASAYLGLGETSLAARTLDRCREHLGDAPIFEVLLDRAQAELLYRLGHSSEAWRICERWVSEPSSFTLGQAWLLETFSKVLDLTGNRTAGLNRAREAILLYESLGAETRRVALTEWVQQAVPRRLGRPASSLPFGLTKREVEVLWMATQGKTARETATTLFLSEGTVRKHLENIKIKAGVSRKAELVTFAARLGINPDSIPTLIHNLTSDPSEGTT